MKELEIVLLRISEISSLNIIPSLAKSWQAVLISILSKSAIASDDQLDDCLHAFNLIQRCPEVQCLDLSTLAEHYSNLELHVCAIACILMSTVCHNKSNLLKNIPSVGPEKLLNSLTFTRSKCVDSAILAEVEDMIFQLIVEEDQAAIDQNTPYKAAFAAYVQQNDTDSEDNIQPINGH